MSIKILLIVIFQLFLVSICFGQTQPLGVDSAFISEVLQDLTKGHNHKRYVTVKNYKEKYNLSNFSIKTEAIDWLGLYRNVIYEKKGKTDSVVYIICHYDKVDGNIFTTANVLVNGYLDKLLAPLCFSKGAYDNGSGVISLLALMHWINGKDMHYTYRFLFAGMEEYGLRGSRCHVSNLSQKEWSKCIYAINIDMIAYKNQNISLSANISDSVLVQQSLQLAQSNDLFIVEKNAIPMGASSDFKPFTGQSLWADFIFSFQINLLGAFIPQRSYFTAKKTGIPIINFSDDNFEFASALFSSFSPVAFGNIHSFRDQAEHIDSNQMLMYNSFFKAFILANEK